MEDDDDEEDEEDEEEGDVENSISGEDGLKGVELDSGVWKESVRV